MKKNATRILFGVVVLAMAVFVLGAAFGLWGAEISLKGWWTVFLIVPALASIFSEGPRIWNLILLGVGAWLLAEQQGWITNTQARAVFGGVMLLILGLWLMFGWIFKPKHQDTYQSPEAFHVTDAMGGEQDFSDCPQYVAVFSGRDVYNACQSMRGMKATAVFGGLDLNLSNAVPAGDITLYVTAVFGGIDLIVPRQARIRVEGIPVFGGYDSTFPPNHDESLPLITIKCSAVFGGVDLK